VDPDQNIVLIGMPGAGKSTAGVLLAKHLSRAFIDTDVVIQSREGRRLRGLITALGEDGFLDAEESYILSLDVRRHVIATGGSVVYLDRAMAHLKRGGALFYLHVSVEVVMQRAGEAESRGVVMRGAADLRELYAQREPLYRRWADRVLDCTGRDHEAVVRDLIAAVDLNSGDLLDGQ
jgi:shikimate kinase